MLDQIQNRELFEKCEQFMRKSLDLLISYILKSEPIPEGSIERMHFVNLHREEIMQLPQFEQCLRVMQNDNEISKHIDRSNIFVWRCFSHILIKLLKGYYKKREFDQKLFERMYRNLEQFFYNDTVPIVGIAPLHNFNSDVDSIELGNGLVIRKMSNEEKEELLDNISMFFKKTNQY